MLQWETEVKWEWMKRHSFTLWFQTIDCWCTLNQNAYDQIWLEIFFCAVSQLLYALQWCQQVAHCSSTVASFHKLLADWSLTDGLHSLVPLPELLRTLYTRWVSSTKEHTHTLLSYAIISILNIIRHQVGSFIRLACIHKLPIMSVFALTYSRVHSRFLSFSLLLAIWNQNKIPF